jgi:hypothetical protein
MGLTRRGWTAVAGVVALVAIFVIVPPTGVAFAGLGVALVAIGAGLQESPSG